MKPGMGRISIIAAAAILGIGLSGAVYAAVNDEPDPSEGMPKPGPTKSLDSDGMSLEEIAQAASAKPGEVVPPCPDAKTVTELKEADIDFGPCDPVFEVNEEPLVMGTPGVEVEQESKDVCVASPGGRAGGPGYEVCGYDVDVVGVTSVDRDGETCTRVTYTSGKEEVEQVETFCKDPKSADGHDHTHTHND